jgi:hypothetical protein
MPIKIFRGETLTTAMAATVGDITGATIVATMKKARVAKVAPPASTPVAATLNATPVANVANTGKPGWHLEIPAAQTNGLPLGDYVAQAKITLPSGVVDYSPLMDILIEERI